MFYFFRGGGFFWGCFHDLVGFPVASDFFNIKVKEFQPLGTILINDIKVKYFELHEPPKSTDEMMALSHYFMFELFKETILDIYNGNVSATPQAKFTSEL